MQRPTDLEFLCSFVAEVNGCWLWLGPVNRNGYGLCRGARAHRLSYELHVGAIPGGLMVCHHCDVRNCINPDHLFIGDHVDNMNDMITKRRGSTTGNARLTQRVADAIREEKRKSPDLTLPELGRRFGVTKATIDHILRGWSWTASPQRMIDRAELAAVKEDRYADWLRANPEAQKEMATRHARGLVPTRSTSRPWSQRRWDLHAAKKAQG